MELPTLVATLAIAPSTPGCAGGGEGEGLGDGLGDGEPIRINPAQMRYEGREGMQKMLHQAPGGGSVLCRLGDSEPAPSQQQDLARDKMHRPGPVGPGC